MTLKQMVDNLLSLGELKHAEKLKSDFKMNETTFAWLRVKAMARNRLVHGRTTTFGIRIMIFTSKTDDSFDDSRIVF